MKILIADDERDIADAIGVILKFNKFDSDVVYNGTDAYNMASQNLYDGIILDIMMPGMDGITVLTKLREDGDTTPILMLTAKAQVEDRIGGLDKGADDYLAKPFDKNELIARINVMFRRLNTYNSPCSKFGNIKLDTESLEISNGNSSLRLAGKEMEIMNFLMHHRNKTIPETMLIEKFWDTEEYEDKAITLYINYLKNKLNSIKASIEIVSTENGIILQEKG